jgi:NAD(P)-dependent dehydrogenase (short-subunit alcohol dehydrogenase family)
MQQQEYDRSVDPAQGVVAITGASSGIGRAAAEQLAREGAAVALFARRADRLEEVVEAIAAAGGRALAVPGDVTIPDDCVRLVSRTVEVFGRLDVMICNAGVGYHGPLDETPPAHMQRIVEVNLLGTLYTARAALAVFRRQGRGHLIAISSYAGRRGIGGTSVYGATKAGMINMVESLRAEFVGTDLHASVILPVSVETEFRSAITRDFGFIVDGEGPTNDVGMVVDDIVACIRRPKAEIYTHRRSWYIAVLNAIAPARADRFMQRFTRRVRSPASGHAQSDT